MFLPPLSVLTFFPDYRSTQVAWQGLTPVAAWVIEAVRPARLVELGSYRGDSFFSFLQAAQGVSEVRDLCAIDTWAGDIHTGHYADDVLAQFNTELALRADPRARAIRSTFAAARDGFAPGSINLLHIDGAHDYASVKDDFETWLPKMAADGVILFHDTIVRKAPYSVWQLWEEIVAAYPGRTFNFTHSNGLGVLCLGQTQTHAFHELCAAAPADQARICLAMATAGARVVGTTGAEFRLHTAGGTALPDAHVFARGADLEQVRALVTAADLHPQAIESLINARLDTLLRDQTAELAAALDGEITARASRLINTRIDTLLQGQTAELAAALDAEITARASRLINTRIDTLLRDQTADLAAALDTEITARATAVANARIDTLLQGQTAELAAALDAEITVRASRLINARIDTLLHDQTADLAAALDAEITARATAIANARIDTLLGQQTADLAAALDAEITARATAIANARIDTLLRDQARDVVEALKPALAPPIQYHITHRLTALLETQSDPANDALNAKIIQAINQYFPKTAWIKQKLNRSK
ncbi:MAG: class I SAM-dependent methyltransferase, partial [Paracoccaceae bacterium]